jgi:exonuclease III
MKVINVFQLIGESLSEFMTFNEDRLTRQGVHPNPGPTGNTVECQPLKIITYNCRGLRNINKLKRLLLKLDKLITKGAVVALQETHLIDEKILNTLWRHKYILNCKSTDQKGVALLFSEKYEISKQYIDEEERLIVVNLKNDLFQMIVANVYCPNDTRENITFLENLFSKLLEFKFEYPDSYIITMGDMNICVGEEDALNRKQSQNEKILVKNLVENNKMLKLKDCYRHLQKKDGYTWNRGSCFSRLDYVFVSEGILRFVRKCEVNWAFERSDHAAVVVDFKMPGECKMGPGISRTNNTILENPLLVKQLRENLKDYMAQTPVDWNPNTKLEFFKVGIRTTFSEMARQNRVETHLENEMLEGELNHLQNVKIRLAGNKDLPQEEQMSRMNTVELAIGQVQGKLLINCSQYCQNNF